MRPASSSRRSRHDRETDDPVRSHWMHLSTSNVSAWPSLPHVMIGQGVEQAASGSVTSERALALQASRAVVSTLTVHAANRPMIQVTNTIVLDERELRRSCAPSNSDDGRSSTGTRARRPLARTSGDRRRGRVHRHRETGRCLVERARFKSPTPSSLTNAKSATQAPREHPQHRRRQDRLLAPRTASAQRGVDGRTYP